MSKIKANLIYKITVINFNKYNLNIKKGHKSTLISNNFCSDSKLTILPLTVRWMFLGILLICGDQTRDTVEISERHLRELLESSWSVDRAMGALQQLQVLSYDKFDPFIREEKRKENKRKEKVVEEREEDKNTEQPPAATAEIQKFEQPKIAQISSVDKFHGLMTEGAWIESLEKTDLSHPTFTSNIALIKKRFKETSEFEEWVETILKRQKYIDLHAKGEKVACDNYISSALRREMGLK